MRFGDLQSPGLPLRRDALDSVPLRSLVSLLPENEDFEPIEVDLKYQSLVIEGVVVGVIRNGLALH